MGVSIKKSALACNLLLIFGSLGCSGQPGASGDAIGSVASEVAVSGDLAAGDAFVCIIAGSSGKVKCWGDNAFGQLGLGDVVRRGDNPGEMGEALPWVNLGQSVSQLPVTAIAAGEYHACALLRNTPTGTLKCWGYNGSGQLGLGDTVSRGTSPGQMGVNLPAVNLGTGRTVKSVVAGFRHTCAILDNDQVKCWGQNSYGQLGLGNTNHRGDNANEMGDALPVVPLGTGRTAKFIAAGGFHTCAILDNNTTKCWGFNNRGQLGLGDMVRRGDNANEMGDALPVVDLGPSPATQLALGLYHSCAILSTAQVKCWGENSRGQLGLGDTIRRGDGPNEMGAQLPIVDIQNFQVTGITSKRDHTCVRYFDPGHPGGSFYAVTKCWGANTYGQLGCEDTADKGDNPGEMGDVAGYINIFIQAGRIAAAGSSTCASDPGFSAGTKCWGRGVMGALGYENTTNIGDNQDEMAYLPTVNLGSAPPCCDGGF